MDGQAVRSCRARCTTYRRWSKPCMASTLSSTASDSSTPMPRRSILATHRFGVGRLLVVGGAGSLDVLPGLALVDAPDFSAEYRAEALGELKLLKTLPGLAPHPAPVCPPLVLTLGECTSKFRIGQDNLLVGADGQSRISTENFAIPAIDEIEHPHHSRQRFTVGY